MRIYPKNRFVPLNHHITLSTFLLHIFHNMFFVLYVLCLIFGLRKFRYFTKSFITYCIAAILPFVFPIIYFIYSITYHCLVKCPRTIIIYIHKKYVFGLYASNENVRPKSIIIDVG